MQPYEYLEANRSGAYCSSTRAGGHSRKYHGLLVATSSRPPGKYVFVSSLDETVIWGNQTISLASHQYPNDLVYPDGASHLFKTELEPWPTFYYQLPFATLKKELVLTHEESRVIARYQLIDWQTEAFPVVISLTPLYAFRSIHKLSKKNDTVNTQLKKTSTGFQITPYSGMPALDLCLPPSTETEAHFFWNERIIYPAEAERGYPFQEDCFGYGSHHITLAPGQAIHAGFSVEAPLVADLGVLLSQESDRRQQLQANLPSDPVLKKLWTRADDFIYYPTPAQPAILAGFHWFSSWGRDTMISLPGLLLTRKKYGLALQIINAYAEKEKDGLIPNLIDFDFKGSAYNSIDAVLWMAWAAEQYLLATDDWSGLETAVWPAMQSTLRHFSNGTLFNIHVGAHGFLYAGSPDTQLTWMDAHAYGKPVTPRFGYAVEIQALWYVFLKLYLQLSSRFTGKKSDDTQEMLQSISANFHVFFWDEASGYYADFVEETSSGFVRNLDLRPNQIFALSLTQDLVPAAFAKRVLQIVEEKLVTPYGLRTLSPDHPLYQGRCQGSQDQRDSAYHNGTVWPWLMGHYGMAVINSASPEEMTLKKKQLHQQLEPLCQFILKSGGLVPEIADGDFPHEFRGCIHQAWSVAELIRILI